MRFDYRHTRCYEIVWIFQFKAFKSCWTHNNNWCAIFDSLRKIMLGKFGILPAQHHRDTIHCHRDPSVAVPSIESPLEPNDINQIAKKNFSLRLRTKSVFPPFLLWSECLLVVGFFFTFILVHFGSITFYVISNVFICLFSHTFLLKQIDDRFVFADFVIIPLAAPTPNAHTNTSLWNFSLLPLLVDICDTQREFLFYTPYNFSVTVKKVKL